MEGLANRDSLPYAEKYGMGEVSDLKNLFRGTLRFVEVEYKKDLADDRYKGFSTLLDSFRRLGLLSSEPVRGIERWDQFLASSTQGVVGQEVKKGDMGSVMRDILGQRQEETEDALRWSVGVSTLDPCIVADAPGLVSFLPTPLLQPFNALHHHLSIPQLIYSQTSSPRN